MRSRAHRELARRLGLATVKDAGRIRSLVQSVAVVEREERAKLERRVADLEDVLDELAGPGRVDDLLAQAGKPARRAR